MSAAAASIDTPMRPGIIRQYPVAASTTIYAGTIVALNSSGYAIPGADTAGLRVIGRAETDVDNSAGDAGDLNVDVRKGVFCWNNSGSAVLDSVEDCGKLAYVEDDNTVAETSTHKVKAGVVVDIDSSGVWVDCSANLDVPTAITDGTTNGTAAAAADLAALKAETELIGDLARAMLAALVTAGIAK